MFDPRIPYHRRMWHYESDRPLSVAQLIALGSLDARTAALLWLLVERHQSLIVSGPTDPTPGVGKTTTLNALLGFLPAGTTLVYTLGMYEEFEFRDQTDPATTCVLANEVSDHLRIYMWDGVARTLLRLPRQGYAVATSCHADTVRDVLHMLRSDLHLTPADVRQLGVIVNIGIVGRVWPPRRRFLTVNFIAPDPAATGKELCLLPLATWDARTDTFTPATAEVLADVARAVDMPLADFHAALDHRTARLQQLSEGRGAGPARMREAVDTLVAEERGETWSSVENEPDREDAADDQGAGESAAE